MPGRSKGSDVAGNGEGTGSTPVTRHLERMQHDVTCQTTEIWCEAQGWMRDGLVTSVIDECTCIDCLDELRRDGQQAHQRIEALRRFGDPAWIRWAAKR